jgi:hypothetical protein
MSDVWKTKYLHAKTFIGLMKQTNHASKKVFVARTCGQDYSHSLIRVNA